MLKHDNLIPEWGIDSTDVSHLLLATKLRILSENP
jgi:hypothetical protein